MATAQYEVDRPSSSWRANTRDSSRSRVNRVVNTDTLARGLGWFSVGLGLAEILIPRTVSKVIGVEERSGLLRTLGVRELVSGVGILTNQNPTGWLWSRVGGDAVDLALLGGALASDDTGRVRASITTAAVAGVTALDVFCSREYSRQTTSDQNIRFKVAIAVNSSPEEAYRYWRDLSNLPKFMQHLKDVRVIDEKRSHWVAQLPTGVPIEWDSEIVNEKPNEWIAWRSTAGDVQTGGLVRFERAPGGRGTLLKADFRYTPPAGVVGVAAGKLLNSITEQTVKGELRRFKQLIETGEIATTRGQSSGRRNVVSSLLTRGAKR
jgi:uncharacterized membrane protein